MLVCHCEAVNDRRIASAVRSGALSCDQIAAECGAGTRCGGCRPTIEALLRSLGPVEQPVAIAV